MLSTRHPSLSGPPAPRSGRPAGPPWVCQGLCPGTPPLPAEQVAQEKLLSTGTLKYPAGVSGPTLQPSTPLCHPEHPHGESRVHDCGKNHERCQSSQRPRLLFCQVSAAARQSIIQTRDFESQSHLACWRCHCAHFTGEETKALEVTEVEKVCSAKEKMKT